MDKINLEIEVSRIGKYRIALMDKSNNVRFMSVHKKDNEWLYNYLSEKL